jgi:formylglycine-generating enzyme required for sulfatase activity
VTAARLSLRLADGVALEFALVPPGEFLMGGYGEGWYEEPRHRVRFHQGFYLGVYPVTQAQFAVFTAARNLNHENYFSDRPSHPAERMDWFQACGFCDWLQEICSDSIPPGFRASLPTEAQWEYACRAGTETEYYTGDGEAALDVAGWFDQNSGGSTQPVGQKVANAWGLHDMHGNVFEWCLDEWDAVAYSQRPEGVVDPVVGDVSASVESKNRVRVVRGGSWIDSAWNCRSAFRFRWSVDYRDWDLGFRACLVPGPVDRRARVK